MKKLILRAVEYSAEEKSGKRYITGVIPYNSRSVDMGFIEVIAPSAFSKCLADKSNVRALFCHDAMKVLGSVKAGTLSLRSESDGLHCTVELPNTTYAADLFEVVTRGDVTTMSFGFIPVKYDDIGGVRTLREVKLFEVSFGVPNPAYEETESTTYVRSYMLKREIDLDKIGEALKAAEGKGALTDEQQKQIKGLVDDLSSLLPKAAPAEPAAPPKEELKPKADPQPKPPADPEAEKATQEKEALEKELLLDEIDDELKSAE